MASGSIRGKAVVDVDLLKNLGFQYCDYLFVGKTVNALCSLGRGHPSGHGAWRDPVSGEPI